MTREGIKQLVLMWHSAFPDLHYTIEDLIAEGDKVVERWMATGTHEGELFGISPTGKPIKGQGILVHRIVDGKIVAIWEIADGLGLMQQLGVIPPLEEGEW